jgi:hypothetical protein
VVVAADLIDATDSTVRSDAAEVSKTIVRSIDYTNMALEYYEVRIFNSCGRCVGVKATSIQSLVCPLPLHLVCGYRELHLAFSNTKIICIVCPNGYHGLFVFVQLVI